MAVYSGNIADNNQKVKDYLYKLNQDLIYMFNNMTPEDNFSKEALQVYAKSQDKVAELSVSVDGIFMNYLKGDSLIASINLDDSGVSIKANKITLEGLVTANQNFKILLDGSMEAKNGKFSGRITASSFSTKSDYFYADDNEAYIGGFHAYESGHSGAQYLATVSEDIGMGDHPEYAFWAGSSGAEPPFRVTHDGRIYCRNIYAGGDSHSISYLINDLEDRVYQLEMNSGGPI